MNYPNVILLMSGKRKSGKDYIAEKLQTILNEKCTILRISEPLKGQYAKAHNLNIAELLSDSAYKEKYRLAMINWSDEIREKDPGFFCRAACDSAKLKPIWIVSDIRRATDINWFKNTYGLKIKTVRVSADEEIRIKRGYIFTEGVDNVVSECGLDDYMEWDLKVTNNNEQNCADSIQKILQIIVQK